MSEKLNRQHRPRIGLALSGGAGRGIAHIGVLRALEENEIPIDAIAGASAGALIGGCYAAGLSIVQLEEMARTFRWRHMGALAGNAIRRHENSLRGHGDRPAERHSDRYARHG